MNKVKFHIILKEIVLPEHFIYKNLKETLEPKQTEIPDLDWETVKDSITVEHFTGYNSIQRFSLGFTVDFTTIISLGVDEIRKLILDFGKSFRQYDFVEGVFRFEDTYMLDEIIRLHKEIFEIEMQIRKILSHILALNLNKTDLFSYNGEFEGLSLSSNSNSYNDKIKREKIFREYMENELFHILFSTYNVFNKPKEPKSDKIIELIKKSTSFDELKELFTAKGITDNINPNHKNFVNELSECLKPIEDVRNEIMHNREIKESQTINKLTQKTDYLATKTRLNQLISGFWQQEGIYEIENQKQAEYILKTIFDNIRFDNTDNVYIYENLDFDEESADDLDDLRQQFTDIINYNLTITDNPALESLIETYIEKIRNEIATVV